MELKIQELKNLMDEKYNGNYNAFARATGINVALLFRILNGKGGAGLKTLNLLIAFFKKENLSVEDYIFLP